MISRQKGYSYAQLFPKKGMLSPWVLIIFQDQLLIKLKNAGHLVPAALKSPYMLLKGWHRLFHDCIGREGPFLESICVPFASLRSYYGLLLLLEHCWGPRWLTLFLVFIQLLLPIRG